MVNPFQAFRDYAGARREIPLDRILAQRDHVIQQLLQSYHNFVEEESRQLVWVVEQGALSRAYNPLDVPSRPSGRTIPHEERR